MKLIKESIYIFIISILLIGCGKYVRQPMKVSNARLGPETPQKKSLSNLPEPKQKIVCAVYKFTDQTGQYKPSETGANWSTAVTQGATSILNRALEESNWFLVIERENIGNLLNERKIIRSSRAQYLDENNKKQHLLTPLLFAGIILEGGITSYETNILTGGAGIRYFGSGISGQYREDRVTVYLRAVSTSNGKILKTVYTTKSILSQEIDANFFRFVKLKTLLEAETGFTYNEPSDMAVTEAIEKAVEGLIIEGIIDKLWEVSDTTDSTSTTISDYIKEKNNNYNLDEFNRYYNVSQRGKWSIGINGGGNYYYGDYPESKICHIEGINFGCLLNKNFKLEFQAANGEFKIKNKFYQKFISGDINLNYYLLTKEKFTPFGYAGIGLCREYEETSYSLNEYVPKIQIGLGFEYLIKPKFGLFFSGKYNYFLSDGMDGIKYGKYYDEYYSGTIGLKYYFK